MGFCPLLAKMEFKDKPNALPLSLGIRKQPSTRAKLKTNSSDTHACQTCFTSVSAHFADISNRSNLSIKKSVTINVFQSACAAIFAGNMRAVCPYGLG